MLLAARCIPGDYHPPERLRPAKEQNSCAHKCQSRQSITCNRTTATMTLSHDFRSVRVTKFRNRAFERSRSRLFNRNTGFFEIYLSTREDWRPRISARHKRQLHFNSICSWISLSGSRLWKVACELEGAVMCACGQWHTVKGAVLHDLEQRNPIR